jgi:hypothetical protein
MARDLANAHSGFRADVFVVLALATRVRSVKIHTSGIFCPTTYPEGGGMPLRNFWSRQNLQILPTGAFAGLKEVSIDALEHDGFEDEDTGDDILQSQGDPQMLSSFMALPGLRRLVATGFITDERYRVQDWPLDQGSSAVKSLSLLRSKLAPNDLFDIVGTCSALEDFRYEI